MDGGNGSIQLCAVLLSYMRRKLSRLISFICGQNKGTAMQSEHCNIFVLIYYDLLMTRNFPKTSNNNIFILKIYIHEYKDYVYR